jgi:hypothetical protein
LSGGAEAPLNQLTMLVTAEGKWVLPDGEEFLAALGDPNPDYDAVGFAVRNLGFVKFQVLDRLVTEIELHPRNVDKRALLAVEEVIGQSATNLFRIRYLDTEWRSEISASAEHTMARLRELCAPVFQPPETERFHIEPQNLSMVFDNRERRAEGFGLLAMKWRASFGQYDSSVLSFAVETGLLDRLVIVEVKKTPTADPILRYIGAGHATWLDPDRHFTAIGESLQNLPDKDYGAWASELYKNVARSGQPHYDCVTASIRRQSSVYRTRYERLLLPWKTSSDDVLLTVCNRRAGSDLVPAIERSAPDSSRSKNAAKSS